MTTFRCGELDPACPEYICSNHQEGQTEHIEESSTGTVSGRPHGATTDASEILSERSKSPQSTDSDDEHIVEVAIR